MSSPPGSATPDESASRKPRLYYGWVIVAGVMAVGAMSMGMGGVNLGLYIDPMTEDLGIGNSVFGWAQTARLVGFAIGGWVIGRLIDRRGARLPLAIAGVVAGLVMLGVSLVTAGWQIVLLFGVMGLTGLQGGGGSLFMAVPLAAWFVRLRGRAMSVAFIGLPLGIFFLAPLTQVLIDEVGWRTSWRVLGLAGMIVILLVAIFIMRRRPEDMGLLPDGDASPAWMPGLTATPPAAAEFSWTRTQALRSTTFWRLAGVDRLRMLAMSTLGVFRIPFFIDDQGIDAQAVAFALSAEAVASVLVALPTGWAVDRFRPRYVAALSTSVMVLGVLSTMAVSETWHVFVATMLFGVGVSSFIICQNAMWPAYFGNVHIGAIRGYAMPVTLAFAAFGAPLTGIVRDEAGTYMPAWIGALAGLGIATVLLVSTRRPARLPEQSAEKVFTG